jgi:hypothetical protein
VISVAELSSKSAKSSEPAASAFWASDLNWGKCSPMGSPESAKTEAASLGHPHCRRAAIVMTLDWLFSALHTAFGLCTSVDRHERDLNPVGARIARADGRTRPERRCADHSRDAAVPARGYCHLDRSEPDPERRGCESAINEIAGLARSCSNRPDCPRRRARREVIGSWPPCGDAPGSSRRCDRDRAKPGGPATGGSPIVSCGANSPSRASGGRRTHPRSRARARRAARRRGSSSRSRGRRSGRAGGA